MTTYVCSPTVHACYSRSVAEECERLQSQFQFIKPLIEGING